MPTRYIIGLAPGTSLHGVDAVLLETHGSGLDLTLRIVHSCHQAYPKDFRNMMLRLHTSAAVEVRHLSLLHRLLGEIFAQAGRQVVDEARISLQQVMCLGCAGQGVWQEPEGRYPSLLETGMPAVIAERTGLTTISDFRSRDLAAGGLGTPIEALADYLLFRHPQEDRVLVHLGGTARILFLPAGCKEMDIVGFDAVPCNMLLDGLVRHGTAGRESSDGGGRFAVQGRCIEPVLESWLDHPYWNRRPPKALSAAAFGDGFAAQAVKLARQHDRNDLLCTATHLISRVVAQSVRRLRSDGRLPDRVLLSGCGVRNGLLWQLLEQQLGPALLVKTDSVGVPPESRRAISHGILAAMTLDGVPANVPAATGAAGSRLIGSLTPGTASNWARCLSWMAAQAPVSYRTAG